MKHIALAGLLLAALGCGEPKAPPPGAPTEKMETPDIQIPDSTAPTEDKGAPADTSTETESADGEPQEK